MTKYFRLFIMLMIVVVYTQTAMAQNMSPVQMRNVGGGVGIGSIIAIVASWSRNKSVLWAIIHAILGWLYVIYFVLSGGAKK